jgi:N-acetylglucosamine transport system permease protein
MGEPRVGRQANLVRRALAALLSLLCLPLRPLSRFYRFMRSRAGARFRFIVGFLSPAVLIYGFFVGLPVVQAFYFSLFRWRGVSAVKTFVGTDNFVRLTHDSIFARSIWHNILFLLVGGSVILLLALLIAHCLQGKGRAISTLRGLFLFPQIMSLVVVSVLWLFIFAPNRGLLDLSMDRVGLGAFTQPWLGSRSTAIWAVIAVFVWHGLGFYIMLLSAGIRSIPTEVSEAATLDGAFGMKKFREVTLPMLWSIMRVSVAYLVISSLNVFALVRIMTEGKPDHHTEVMLTHLYNKGFTANESGYATALAVANFALVMLVTWLVMKAFGRDPQEPRERRA